MEIRLMYRGVAADKFHRDQPEIPCWIGGRVDNVQHCVAAIQFKETRLPAATVLVYWLWCMVV